MEFQVKDNGVFAIFNEQQLAEITYYTKGNQLIVDHTFVDDSLRGQGIASLLVQHTIGYARKNNLKIVPLCSYVVKWFENHPDQDDILF